MNTLVGPVFILSGVYRVKMVVSGDVAKELRKMKIVAIYISTASILSARLLANCARIPP